MGLISRVSSRTYSNMSISALIIGASRGIGLELTRHLVAKQNHSVIATCRNLSADLENLSNASKNLQVLQNIDVAKDQVVDQLRKEKLPDRLDIVIVNAGVGTFGTFDDIDFDNVAWQFNTNSVGPLRVAKGIETRLSPGSKFAIITSRMGSIADNGSGGIYGYRMSKAAVNAAGKSLSIDLKDKQVSVALIHPGFVKTDMTSHDGLIEAAESAEGILKRVDQMTMETTGAFWHANGKEDLPW